MHHRSTHHLGAATPRAPLRAAVAATGSRAVARSTLARTAALLCSERREGVRDVLDMPARGTPAGLVSARAGQAAARTLRGRTQAGAGTGCHGRNAERRRPEECCVVRSRGLGRDAQAGVRGCRDDALLLLVAVVTRQVRRTRR